ncbi:hypothetical protein LguiB_022279 [Lonicera macranthoides]
MILTPFFPRVNGGTRDGFETPLLLRIRHRSLVVASALVFFQSIGLKSSNFGASF